MGKAKKSRSVRVKFAQTKRLLSPKDCRLKGNMDKEEVKRKKAKEAETNHVKQVPTSMFFAHNTALGPPYHVLIDTNFINFSIKNKLDIVKAMMDCLLAKAIPCVTDCVVAELEKLGPKYRVALRLSKDPRFERLPCSHQGTYADDCLVQRIEQHRCYIVATCDKELKRRIRKIAGVPIMYISNRKFSIERMAEAFGAPPT